MLRYAQIGGLALLLSGHAPGFKALTSGVVLMGIWGQLACSRQQANKETGHQLCLVVRTCCCRFSWRGDELFSVDYVSCRIGGFLFIPLIAQARGTYHC